MVAGGIAEAVGVPGGIAEIVFPVVFVHPGGFKEAAVVVAGGQRLSVFIEDNHIAGFFAEFKHVVAQTGHPGGQRRFPVGRLMAALYRLVVPVALQLSAP